jgi:hypothetical protein
MKKLRSLIRSVFAHSFFVLLPLSTYGQSPGTLTTIAAPFSDDPANNDVIPIVAHLNQPEGISLDRYGNLFISNTQDNNIFFIQNFTAKKLPDLSTVHPKGLCVNKNGDIYIADSQNNRIGLLKPDGTYRIIAGGGAGNVGGGFTQGNPVGDGEPATQAILKDPTHVALDHEGNLFIADSLDHRIRKVGLDGIIHTVVGTGKNGSAGDGGPAIRANISQPYDLAFDLQGNLYFTDDGNGRIQRVSVDGIISTVAGTDGPENVSSGSALDVIFYRPKGLAIDSQGNLFFCSLNRVWEVDSNDKLKVVAGNGNTGDSYAYNVGSALDAYLSNPTDLEIDGQGNLYIADTDHGRIRKVYGVAAPGVIQGQPALNSTLYGDINFDGRVNLQDVQLALKFVTGLAQPGFYQLQMADLQPAPNSEGLQRGDGRIKIDDVLSLLRLSVGLANQEDFRIPISIEILPKDVELLTGSQLQFAIKIKGTDYTTVKYYVNDVEGGIAPAGGISGKGVYYAPLNLPQDRLPFHVKVVSQADPTKSATATVHLIDTLAKNIRLVGYTPLDGTGRNGDVWVRGNYAYVGSWVGNGTRGVRVVDISDPTHPQLVAHLPAPSDNTDMEDVTVTPLETEFFKGDVAFVGVQQDLNRTSESAGLTGFMAWDVTHPTEPILLSHVKFTGGAHNLYPFQRDGRSYVAAAIVYDINPSMKIFDVTDPAHPVLVSTLGTYTHDMSFNTDATRAFVADVERGLFIADTTNLSEPKVLGLYRPLRMTYGHTAVPTSDGHYVVFGDENLDRRTLPAEGTTNGIMTLVDVSNPQEPKTVSSFSAREPRMANRYGWYSMHNAWIDGNLAYLSWYSLGVRVVDLSNPEQPKEVGYYVPPATKDPQGGIIPYGRGGVSIPMTPLVWGVYQHTDGLIYASDINAGLYILEYTGPKS